MSAVRYLSIAALMLGSCVITPNKYPKPNDLAPTWEVDRLRVLAIVAEPPEIRPGETAVFRSLVVGPGSDVAMELWLACPPEEPGGIGFGCELDTDLLSEDATFEDLAEAGLLLVPEYTAPDDLLAEWSEEERLEGGYVTIQVSVFPSEFNVDIEEFNFNDFEAAYKRLVVSEATTPNLNPWLGDFTVDGVPTPEHAVVHLDADQQYNLAVQWPSEAIETYEFTKDGVVEHRTEEPYVSWYTTGGEIFGEYTLYPYLETTWQAPPHCAGDQEDSDDCIEEHEVRTGTWWAVGRDRRGGMTWREQHWQIGGAGGT